MAPADELELIARIRERLAQAAAGRAPAGDRGRVVLGSGDDAAITVPGGATVTSVDAIVDGIHFRRRTAPPRSIGHKALAAALSDLAAMGAEAGEAYVQLAIPEDLDETGCLEIADGAGALAADLGVEVIGGDIVRSPVLVIAVTAVGHAASADGLVRRSGARPGDALAVTGTLGGAAAGLMLLDHPELGDRLVAEDGEGLRRRHLEPEPRLATGRALAKVGARAMIDISDGLGRDAAQLAVASGVHAEVELELLPLQAGVEGVAIAAGVDPLDLAAGGGEDYELLVALPPDRLDDAVAAAGRAGDTLTTIGKLSEGVGVTFRDGSGGERRVTGFDHLQRSAGEPP